MVPVGCAARFERRLVRGETPDTVLDEIRTRLSGLGDVSVRLYRVSLDCYTGRTFTVDDFHPAWVLGATPVARRRCAASARRGCQRRRSLLRTAQARCQWARWVFPRLSMASRYRRCAMPWTRSVRIDALQAAYRGYQALARALTGGMGRMKAEGADRRGFSGGGHARRERARGRGLARVRCRIRILLPCERSRACLNSRVR